MGPTFVPARARIYVMSVSLAGACAHIWYPSRCARGTCASIARLWLPAGLVRADPTGPDETEKEFLGDDPPKPQCRDANQKRPSSRLSPKKSLYAYPKSCGLRVRLLIQRTSSDQGRHSAETGEASRSVSTPSLPHCRPAVPGMQQRRAGAHTWHPGFCGTIERAPPLRAGP